MQLNIDNIRENPLAKVFKINDINKNQKLILCYIVDTILNLKEKNISYNEISQATSLNIKIVKKEIIGSQDKKGLINLGYIEKKEIGVMNKFEYSLHQFL